MPTIRPCLWFDTQAEEAAKLYTSIFKNSKITDISYSGEAVSKATSKPAGSVLTVAFELDGQPFLALNGGPEFKFSEAVSFQIDCESQAEVDEYWYALSAGGEEGPCGWLKDRFGLSWQVVPTILTQLINDPDREKANRVMKAMLEMGKLDIATLEAAANGA